MAAGAARSKTSTARTRDLPGEKAEPKPKSISAQDESGADLGKKVKTALDETRMLILGAQVLFGFQLNAVFQEAFAGLSQSTRLLACAGQMLMVTAIALLIAPSMQHQIVERGSDSVRIQGATSLFAGLALLPLGLSLGIGIYIVFHHLYGPRAALAAGANFFALAAFCWYGLGLIAKPPRRSQQMPQERKKPTSLSTKIDQMLVEARLIIPGAQALLGFQLTVTLMRSFEQLPASSKLTHVAALCAVAVAVILLMTPAALHRISFAGEDSASFFRLGSWFVMAAPVPLAVGIAGDLYVASAKAAESSLLGGTLAIAAFILVAGLWYALPVFMRLRSSADT